MTVSGASGLPIRPRHVVKQYVREALDELSAERIPHYEAGTTITTFVVPTECYGHRKLWALRLSDGGKQVEQ